MEERNYKNILTSKEEYNYKLVQVENTLFHYGIDPGDVYKASNIIMNIFYKRKPLNEELQEIFKTEKPKVQE